MSEVNQVEEQPLIVTIGEFVGTLSLAATIFGGPGVAVIARALAIGSSLIARGAAGNADLKALGVEVKTMVDNKVDPAADQWTSMFARHEDAHARIQASRPSSEDAPPVV